MRYAKYKQTGIPWLPEIPQAWEVRKLNDVVMSLHTGLNPRKFFELNTDGATNYYVTIREIENGQIVFNKDTARINDEALLLCNRRANLEKDDILFSGTGTIGEVVLLDTAPDNWGIKEGIYSIKPDVSSIVPKCLCYVLQSEYFLSLARAKAVGTGVKSIPMKVLLTLQVPRPSFEEQYAIVAYLDDKCGKIDELVAAKEKEVELLKELKQTVIADAVTKGVNGSTPNKETGVFWQPLMPEGWGVRKLRHILRKLDRPRPDGAELLVCTNKGTVNKRGDAKIGLVSEDMSIYQGVASGDLLIHGMDTWHGAIAVSKLNGMCTAVVHVCDSTENKLYVAHYLRNMARGRLFKLLSNGVRQNTSDFRSWEKVAPLQIVLPPREEQDKIVTYIEEKTAKIDQAVAGLTQQVAALKEYKQRLIADVVTGQMRVA